MESYEVPAWHSGIYHYRDPGLNTTRPVIRVVSASFPRLQLWKREGHRPTRHMH